MTRDEAIWKVIQCPDDWDNACDFVERLAALGLLKLDETKNNKAWVLGNKLSERGIYVASHVITNALDAAGLKIVEK